MSRADISGGNATADTDRSSTSGGDAAAGTSDVDCSGGNATADADSDGTTDVGCDESSDDEISEDGKSRGERLFEYRRIEKQDLCIAVAGARSLDLHVQELIGLRTRDANDINNRITRGKNGGG